MSSFPNSDLGTRLAYHLFDLLNVIALSQKTFTMEDTLVILNVKAEWDALFF